MIHPARLENEDAAIAFAVGSMVYKRAFMEGAGLVHVTVVNNAILALVFLPLLAFDKQPIPWSSWYLPALTGLAFTVGHLLNVVALRFGERDEVARRYEDAVVALPAHQCFDADHTTGGEIDLRLVVQEQFVALDRAAQSELGREAVEL